MTRRLILSYLSITAFFLVILEVPLGISFARSERDRLTSSIERDGRVLATYAEDTLEGHSEVDLQKLADDYAARTGGRVVIVDVGGTSFADSDNPGASRNFLSQSRPEFAIAIREGRAYSGSRYSKTLGQRILYVAVPVASSGAVFGAVRITYPAGRLDDRIRRNWISLGLLAGVVLTTVAAVGTVLARSVTRPLRDLGAAVDAFASGAFASRVPTRSGPPEVRNLAHQFNEMATQLEELVGVQRSFVADASHELRTPLTALRLLLENLRCAPPEEIHRDVEAATAEICRLGRLVDGLLALARAEGARPAREAVDAAAVAAERVDVWQALAEEQGARIELDVVSAGGVTALEVPGGLGQILDNLLSNALEVAPAGSRVTVRVLADGATVEMHVVDRGPGLSDEERRRAFDRFWRGADAAPGQGSGLGLAIVAQIAGASGGSVRLDRDAGGGIDAVVILPATKGRNSMGGGSRSPRSCNGS